MTKYGKMSISAELFLWKYENKQCFAASFVIERAQGLTKWRYI